MSQSIIFEPVILDASVFTNAELMRFLISSKRTYHVSSTLYSMLYQRYDFETVHQTLNYFRQPQEWNTGLPSEKLVPELQEFLQPYPFGKDLVNDVYEQYVNSALPLAVKTTILDEWSFIKEHSSLLLVFNQVAATLHQWGVVVVDATNQIASLKSQLLQLYHGIRVFLGIAVSIAALSKAKQGKAAAATAWGGVALALFDP